MEKQAYQPGFSRKVAIIGAGVAGCAAAGALCDHGIDFVVYDKEARPGGLWANNYPDAKGVGLVGKPDAF